MGWAVGRGAFSALTVAAMMPNATFARHMVATVLLCIALCFCDRG